jgi:hypothetical protein
MQRRFALCFFINAKICKLLEARVIRKDMPDADNSRCLAVLMVSPAKELPVTFFVRYQEDGPLTSENVGTDKDGKVISAEGSHASAPNGWRLSGEGGEADRVRCSRGLGGMTHSCASPPIGGADQKAERGADDPTHEGRKPPHVNPDVPDSVTRRVLRIYQPLCQQQRYRTTHE